MDAISFDYLKECVSLVGPCGTLVWNTRPSHHFAKAWQADKWNSIYSGKMAINTSTTRGYKVGQIAGKTVLAHRVVVALRDGGWPSGLVDHINLDKTDNRICNLRVVSPADNRINRGLEIRNTSGCTGVYWNRQRQVWHAQIRRNGKIRHLCFSSDLAVAIAARKAAEATL